MRFLLLALFLLLLTGCTSAPPPADFSGLTDDFIHGNLALSPVTATSVGYHEYRGVPLDELLDDYSAAGLEAQRKFLTGFQMRLAEWGPNAPGGGPLDREQLADLDIMKRNVAFSLYELDTLQDYKHNPTIYVELAGNALFTPYVLNYAPVEKRYQHIIRRLTSVPALMEQAKANLTDAPEVWNRVAQEENQGNIDLIDKVLRKAAPQDLALEYDKAARPAISALQAFNGYLKDTLTQKPSDWRLGKEKYTQKCDYVLNAGATPEQLLADAETELQRVRAEMAKLAAPKTVPQVLNEIAQQHATPQTYMAEARKTLEQATDFVRSKGFLTLPPGGNLQVIETPEFMRGIYAVGGFNAAPPLEPQLGAFYWITPIPSSWPKERIESKLREYNNYGLQELTIHEAMPGHYVQFQYANQVLPVPRRLLRSIFANPPYVEGWAVYAQQLMSDEGYLNNSKALWMTFYKQMLRVLANTILDVRLQTMGMTEQQALDLMMKETYQEKEEATAKYQRAQLSSCQLPSYFAGWRGWLQVRDRYKQRKGAAYSLKEFNDQALRESGVPLPALDRLLQ
jgi:uncharacterized protein (DUF885 family)